MKKMKWIKNSQPLSQMKLIKSWEKSAQKFNNSNGIIYYYHGSIYDHLYN